MVILARVYQKRLFIGTEIQLECFAQSQPPTYHRCSAASLCCIRVPGASLLSIQSLDLVFFEEDADIKEKNV